MDRSRRQKRGRHDAAGDPARSGRLQELIRQEVNFLLRNDIQDPRLAEVEITMVELAGDGSSARLWFTAPEPQGERDEVLTAFERATGYLRNHLADSVGGKKTPDLRFRRDPATRAFSAQPSRQ